MRKLATALVAALAGLAALSCDDGPKGYSAGSACTAAAECAAPPEAACLKEFKPVKPLIKPGTDPATAAFYEDIGLEFPGGYCSTVGNCATDKDCSLGGTCFVALAGVSKSTLDELSASVPFDVNAFANVGLCLQACTSDSECRLGYKCDWPLGDFLSIVTGTTKRTFCVEKPDPCKAAPCKNGGTCKASADGNAFACTCPAGYSGDKCEIDVNECQPNPCKNGAACTDGVNDFVCTCTAGWTGKACDTDIDECAPAPCKNGATCANGQGDYTCTCKAGFTGKSCEIEMNGCTPNPCKNGGTCTPGAGGAFTCACAGTYTGTICDEKCGKSQLITYALTGKFKLTQTPLMAGDGEWDLPGTAERAGGTPKVATAALTLRVHADGKRAQITAFDLGHNVHQSTFGTEIYTNLVHTSAKDACGLATGTIDVTKLTWATCTTPANYGTKAWVTSELASGPGCLAGHGSLGNIWCSGSGCSSGQLAQGDNPVTIPPKWAQPVGAFTFGAADLKTFSSEYWFQPNDKKNALTQMKISSAVETGRVTEVTPECACP